METKRAALIYSLSLILIGFGGYILSGRQSATALIPAFFGFPVLIAAILANKESLRMHAMHVAVLFSIIALGGTTKGLMQLPSLLAGAEFERPIAILSQALTALSSLAFFLVAAKSFIDARKNNSPAE